MVETIETNCLKINPSIHKVALIGKKCWKGYHRKKGYRKNSRKKGSCKRN